MPVNVKILVRAGKHKLGAKVGKYEFGTGPVNTNWGPGRGLGAK